MPYNILRVLSYLKYLEYVDSETNSLKRHYAEPRLYERHDREMFEGWKERAETYKESFEKLRHAERQEPQIGPPPDETPQEELTRGFFDYYQNQIVIKNEATTYYEACLGRPVWALSRRKKVLKPEGGSMMKEEKTELQKAIDNLNNLIDFMEAMLNWMTFA